jgi:hypothetical protein
VKLKQIALDWQNQDIAPHRQPGTTIVTANNKAGGSARATRDRRCDDVVMAQSGASTKQGCSDGAAHLEMMGSVRLRTFSLNVREGS